MATEQRCPNPRCLGGKIYSNKDGKPVVKTCGTCGGRGTVKK